MKEKDAGDAGDERKCDGDGEREDARGMLQKGGLLRLPKERKCDGDGGREDGRGIPEMSASGIGM